MKKWLYIVVACIILAGLTIGITQAIELFSGDSAQHETKKKVATIKELTFEEKLQQEKAIENVDNYDIKIKSEEALLINLTTNEVEFAKNAEEKAYPASLTKLMTVLVGLEQINDLNTKVTVPNSIFTYLTQENASVAGFNPDEVVTAEDLLNGIMLPSGADASLAIAIHVSGNEKEYVKLMNEQAAKLGMTNTHFENVEGLHDENHYTTAHDLMKLMKYALQNPDFRKILTTEKYQVKSTSRRGQGFTFSSTLFSKLDMSKERGFSILGGKTGYTIESGLSLASLANKGDTEYALIAMNAAGTNRTEQFNIVDTLNLYGAIPTK